MTHYTRSLTDHRFSPRLGSARVLARDNVQMVPRWSPLTRLTGLPLDAASASDAVCASSQYVTHCRKSDEKGP